MEKKNKKFILTFTDKKENQVDVEYTLADSLLATKWISKIKHLKNIKIDPVESQATDLSDIRSLYKKFCDFAKIDPIAIKKIDQPILNKLHEIYEKEHNKLSHMKKNSILYEFHHSIHYNEGAGLPYSDMVIGWGTKEGPLTENFPCNQYYSQSIEQNNIYLPWSELGKKPYIYWKNNEPHNQNRINLLCKPHTTLRAKFFVALKDKTPSLLDKNFIKWFEPFKTKWLEHHNLKKWDNIDEMSAPLLASTDNKTNLKKYKLHKITL